MNILELVNLAIKSKEKSYSPYSKFRVGSALLTKSNRIYTGTNIECVSYSPTNCAERTAFFKAISDGEREFEAISIAGSYSDNIYAKSDFCYPCGVCLQVMAEFCDPKEFKIILIEDNTTYKILLLKELLPYNFKN